MKWISWYFSGANRAPWRRAHFSQISWAAGPANYVYQKFVALNQKNLVRQALHPRIASHNVLIRSLEDCGVVLLAMYRPGGIEQFSYVSLAACEDSLAMVGNGCVVTADAVIRKSSR